MLYSNKIYYETPSDYVSANLEAILPYGRFYLNFFMWSDTLSNLH